MMIMKDDEKIVSVWHDGMKGWKATSGSGRYINISQMCSRKE